MSVATATAPSTPERPVWLESQDGLTVVITGANSGIGLEAARMLAAAGARVVMACRRPDAAEAARTVVQRGAPDAQIDVVQVDLGSLESIESGAAALLELLGDTPIDRLINNAGVMAPATRQVTADAFELQLGVNHLGHFAWTMRLAGQLGAGARVVNVSSMAHRFGRMNWDDLHWTRSYNPWTSYGQSKLANLLFTSELDRRLADAGMDAHAMACHPGYSSTNLQTAFTKSGSLAEAGRRIANAVFAQSAARGAEPTVYAATSKYVSGDQYVGPASLFELWGPPVKVGRSDRAKEIDDQGRLWDVSVAATGVDLSAGPA